MPRRARVRHAGVPQHVIQRGNNRAACFFADEDYRTYLAASWKARCDMAATFTPMCYERFKDESEATLARSVRLGNVETVWSWFEGEMIVVKNMNRIIEQEPNIGLRPIFPDEAVTLAAANAGEWRRVA